MGPQNNKSEISRNRLPLRATDSIDNRSVDMTTIRSRQTKTMRGGGNGDGLVGNKQRSVVSIDDFLSNLKLEKKLGKKQFDCMSENYNIVSNKDVDYTSAK